MSHTAAVTVSLVAGILLCPTAQVVAQDPMDAEVAEAARQFSLGMTDYEAGRFADARVRFERAYELSRAPELLYNIATVAELLRDDASARDAYAEYLRAMPECDDRATVEARLRLLGGGDDGHTAGAGPATSVPAMPTERSDAVEPRALDPAPWLVAGLGALVLVGGAILLGLSELDAATVANAPTWAAAAPAYERAPRLSGAGIAALGVGALTLTLGAVWGAVAPRSGSPTTTMVAFGPGFVVARGTF